MARHLWLFSTGWAEVSNSTPFVGLHHFARWENEVGRPMSYIIYVNILKKKNYSVGLTKYVIIETYFVFLELFWDLFNVVGFIMVTLLLLIMMLHLLIMLFDFFMMLDLSRNLVFITNLFVAIFFLLNNNNFVPTKLSIKLC